MRHLPLVLAAALPGLLLAGLIARLGCARSGLGTVLAVARGLLGALLGTSLGLIRAPVDAAGGFGRSLRGGRSLPTRAALPALTRVS